MDKTEDQIQQIPSSSTSGGSQSTFIAEQNSNEAILGRLELRIAYIKGDFEKLEERVKAGLELNKWIVIAIITSIGIFSGIAFGISNLINGNINSIRQVQKEYYDLLAQDRERVNSSEQGTKNLQNFCLQKNTYWEYKNCLLTTK